MTGRKGFVNGVYVIQVDGYEKMKYWFYSAKDAEKQYRKDNNLRYKHIEWRKAYY